MTIMQQLIPHSQAANPMEAETPAQGHGATALVERLLAYMGLRNDACLARELGVPPFAISKLRKGNSAVDTDMLIRMHEASGLPIGELKALTNSRH
ncbi:transcriptional regulator [Janthinobacterium sp. EB271-G4-7A]|uniref:transcriptional regulator n=1 Tax=Janthinobacterium sp. EB271-G4-7A TaxID=2775056 RepID=UPI001E46B767|nr:transcriptional regulator [Janthinobacterium sp. EB271-G4-7A]MCC7697798.1 transcriptional regulator [Janthinobacterium sp. EB271-G4-7A]